MGLVERWNCEQAIFPSLLSSCQCCKRVDSNLRCKNPFSNIFHINADWLPRAIALAAASGTGGRNKGGNSAESRDPSLALRASVQNVRSTNVVSILPSANAEWLRISRCKGTV